MLASASGGPVTGNLSGRVIRDEARSAGVGVGDRRGGRQQDLPFVKSIRTARHSASAWWRPEFLHIVMPPIPEIVCRLGEWLNRAAGKSESQIACAA